MRIAGWTNKATNTRLEYAILIAFPLQQQLYKRDSMLLYTYIAYLVQYCNNYVLVTKYNKTQFLRPRFDIRVYIAVRVGAIFKESRTRHINVK